MGKAEYTAEECRWRTCLFSLRILLCEWRTTAWIQTSILQPSPPKQHGIKNVISVVVGDALIHRKSRWWCSTQEKSEGLNAAESDGSPYCLSTARNSIHVQRNWHLHSAYPCHCQCMQVLQTEDYTPQAQF
jgi:hypothetical protein